MARGQHGRETPARYRSGEVDGGVLMWPIWPQWPHRLCTCDVGTSVIGQVRGVKGF